MEKYLDPEVWMANYKDALLKIDNLTQLTDAVKNKMKKLLSVQKDTVNKMLMLEETELDTDRNDFASHYEKVVVQMRKLTETFHKIQAELDEVFEIGDQQDDDFFRIEITVTPSSELNKALTDFVNEEIGDHLRSLVVKPEDLSGLISQLSPNEARKIPSSVSFVLAELLECINSQIRKQQYEKWSYLKVFTSVNVPDEKQRSVTERRDLILTKIEEGNERAYGQLIDDGEDGSSLGSVNTDDEIEVIENLHVNPDLKKNIMEGGFIDVSEEVEMVEIFQAGNTNSTLNPILVELSDDEDEIQFIGEVPRFLPTQEQHSTLNNSTGGQSSFSDVRDFKPSFSNVSAQNYSTDSDLRGLLEKSHVEEEDYFFY